MRNRIVFLISFFVLASVAWGQQQPSGGNAQPSAQQNMPGMDMPAHDMSNMKGMSMGGDNNKDEKRYRCRHARHAFHGRSHGYGSAHEDDGPASGKAR